MIAKNLVIIARNIKSIAVEDCNGDYYPREIRMGYSLITESFFHLLNQHN